MKTQHLVLGIVAVLLVGGGVVYFNSQSIPKDWTDGSFVKEEAMTKDGGTGTGSSLASQYLDYSSESLKKASENNGRVVLWFAALAWCPSCQAADKDFKANFDKVPKDITILKVNYDTAKDLKQKYAITVQDTFVQVDNQGKEITRWNSGGQGIKALLANAK
ncbi:thioredoxin family protein [Candidatus Gottesmanbacteria bacterium]|nr:thioredoxin family protein [Candidatus Gottesmanbacteria bacterium]